MHWVKLKGKVCKVISVSKSKESKEKHYIKEGR